jgi:hypothetical protein
MYSSMKLKWFVSITLAGILLVLGLMGGNWGITYAANDKVNAAPIIDRIQPSAVRVGSPYIVMIIHGENFMNDGFTRVKLTATGFEEMLESPQQVLPDGIGQVILPDLLDEPKLYTLTVVHSTANTVPTIPIVPIKDEESNPVLFSVYVPQYAYLSIIHK